MSGVSPLLVERWRSGAHVGEAKPRQLVQIQRGLLDRAYREFEGDDQDFGEIAGSKHNGDPWQAFWRATGPWITVPNIKQVETEGAFDTEGVADPETATLHIDNIIYAETMGAVGSYHVMRRGWLAPWYGWQSSLRADNPAAEQNEWFDVLNGGFRIKIWQGYGDALEPIWTGLIDDTDVTSAPDEIVVTARSFGVALTDQRVFGDNKAKECPSPIIFADRLKADKATKEGGSASASSADSGHPAKGVTKPGDSEFWLSQGHDSPDVTEWVEIRVPAGRYETIYLNPGYDGMEVFLAIYARKGKTGSVKVDGENVADGWVSRSLGVVPGSNGGHPYCKRWGSMDAGGKSRPLGFKLECGDNTVFRVSFRNLPLSPGKNDHRAKVARFVAYKRKQGSDAKKSHWILVEDAADVVKWALMWAGFKEWVVEPMGVRLKEPISFHQSDFLVDIIRHMASQASYVFYVDRPTDDDASLGVPHFVKNRALTDKDLSIQEVRDTDLLLPGLQTKFTKESLSYIIRVRGKEVSKAKDGVALGEDSVRRTMATYLPPWSGAHHNIATGTYDTNYPFANRLSGIVKHVVHTDTGIESEDEAMMMALQIAIMEALAAFTGQIVVPGYPDFSLNGQVSVIDTAAGINTRLWISSRQSTFTTGEDASWTTTLGGGMVDTPDLLALMFDYLILLAKVEAEYGT